MEPLRNDAALLIPEAVLWAPRPKFRDRVWLHVLLFVLTVATTTLVGAEQYAAYLSDFVTRGLPMRLGPLLVRGLWYSTTILGILGCHELGHYFGMNESQLKDV